jgi:ankyrin repeat protein
LESNSLLTLSARYGHVKCMKLLVDHFKANIDICDVGGFTPLILSAYRGCFQGVQYLVRRGANILLVGRLRSGTPLTAEHWAAVQGFQEIFQFLRATRVRSEKKAAQSMNRSALLQNTSVLPSSTTIDDSTAATITNATMVASNATPSVADDNSGVSNGSFCVCGRGFVGEMIACDREGCLIEWYHFVCVGIEEEVRVRR